MSVRRGVVIAVSACAGLAVVAGAFAAGRLTAPGPAIVVTSGAVVEESPAPAMVDVAVDSEVRTPWPVSFVPAADLGDVPATAVGYRLVRTGVSGRGLASGLAQVFGAPGDVVETADGWSTATTDGSGARLSVADDEALSWTYAQDAQDAKAGSPAGPLPTPKQARAVAEQQLAALGVRLDQVDWQVLRHADSVEVIAWQLADGTRTSLAWSVVVGPDQHVIAASGMGASLEALPAYDVVGAATAVARSAQAPWSSLGPVRVMTPGMRDAEADAEAVLPSPSVPAGSTLVVGATTETVIDAELQLAQYRQPDGSVLVLPAYLLTADDGTQWTTLAVGSSDVRFVPAPLPATGEDTTTVSP